MISEHGIYISYMYIFNTINFLYKLTRKQKWLRFFMEILFYLSFQLQKTKKETEELGILILLRRI